jgi:hypothetical protein
VLARELPFAQSEAAVSNQPKLIGGGLLLFWKLACGAWCVPVFCCASLDVCRRLPSRGTYVSQEMRRAAEGSG